MLRMNSRIGIGIIALVWTLTAAPVDCLAAGADTLTTMPAFPVEIGGLADQLLSEQACRNLAADAHRKLVAGDGSGIDSLLDVTMSLHYYLYGPTSKVDLKLRIETGSREAQLWQHQLPGARIARDLGGPVKLVDVFKTPRGCHFIFRTVSQHRPHYYDAFLGVILGKITILDIDDSDLASSWGSSLAKAISPVESDNDLADAIAMALSGKPELALKKLQPMEAKEAAGRPVWMTRIAIAQMISDQRTLEVISQAVKDCPAVLQSPSVAAWLLRKGLLEQAGQSIDAITRKYGKDPYWDALISESLLRHNRVFDAMSKARSAIKGDPTREEGYWALAMAANMKKDFDLVTEALLGLENQTPQRLGDLAKVPFFKDYVLSPSYQGFLKDRPANTQSLTEESCRQWAAKLIEQATAGDGSLIDKSIDLQACAMRNIDVLGSSEILQGLLQTEFARLYVINPYGATFASKALNASVKLIQLRRDGGKWQAIFRITQPGSHDYVELTLIPGLRNEVRIEDITPLSWAISIGRLNMIDVAYGRGSAHDVYIRCSSAYFDKRARDFLDLYRRLPKELQSCKMMMKKRLVMAGQLGEQEVTAAMADFTRVHGENDLAGVTGCEMASGTKRNLENIMKISELMNQRTGGDAYSCVLLTMMCIENKQPDKAIAWGNQAVALEPDLAASWSALISALAAQHKIDEMVNVVDRAWSEAGIRLDQTSLPNELLASSQFHQWKREHPMPATSAPSGKPSSAPAELDRQTVVKWLSELQDDLLRGSGAVFDKAFDPKVSLQLAKPRLAATMPGDEYERMIEMIVAARLKDSAGKGLAVMAQKGGVRLVRLQKSRQSWMATLRFIDGGFPSYVELPIALWPDGKIHVTDWFDHGYSGSNVAFLIDYRNPELAAIGDKIFRLSAAGLWQDVLDELQRQPESVQKKRWIVSTRLMARLRVDTDLAPEIVNEARKSAGPDMYVDMIGLRVLIHKKPDIAMDCIDRLDKLVDDPYLDVIRTRICWDRGHVRQAREHLAKAIRREPDLFEAMLMQLFDTVERRDFAGAIQCIDKMKVKRPYIVTWVQESFYAKELRDSNEYKQWAASQPALKEPQP